MVTHSTCQEFPETFNGLRISKTVNGVTTKIFRTDGQMVGMNVSDGKDIAFLLDGDGNVYGLYYDRYSTGQSAAETYYFAYNAQGDVIGLYEFGGRLIAAYDYDEWGKCTVTALAVDGNGNATNSPDHIAYANPYDKKAVYGALAVLRAEIYANSLTGSYKWD